MALPVAIMVGETKEWIPDLIAKAKKFKVTAGSEKDCDIAPVCYPDLLKNIHKLLDTVEPEGGRFLLDGRNI